ncbi:hypothetical protein NQ317_006290, partial [Molorchus minor]
MTILTKSFSDKKGDKLIAPLVENEQLPAPTAPEDVEAQDHPTIILFPAKARHISTVTFLCLLLTALAVVGIGFIGGKYLYDEYISLSRRHSPSPRFEGYAHIPMGFEGLDDYAPELKNMEKRLKEQVDEMNSFQESFEIDSDLQYEKINVPDFRDGRSGRFVHDFNTNITGIIDITGGRCFVMSLNRVNVLPPKSLFDLIHKMWDGYYKVDTEVIRKTMRVVIPPINDTKTIVVKRSAELHPEAKFAEFAGKGITEFDIIELNVNIDACKISVI